MTKPKIIYFKARRYILKKIPIFRKEWARQFTKTALVGGVGTIVHLMVLYIFTEFFSIYYLISGGIGFIVGSTSNFLITKKWAFREDIQQELFIKYFKFIIISMSALIVNLGVLYVFTEFVSVYYIISQYIANAVSCVIIFTVSKFWIFHK